MWLNCRSSEKKTIKIPGEESTEKWQDRKNKKGRTEEVKCYSETHRGKNSVWCTDSHTEERDTRRESPGQRTELDVRESWPPGTQAASDRSAWTLIQVGRFDQSDYLSPLQNANGIKRVHKQTHYKVGNYTEWSFIDQIYHQIFGGQKG